MSPEPRNPCSFKCYQLRFLLEPGAISESGLRHCEYDVDSDSLKLPTEVQVRGLATVHRGPDPQIIL